MNLEAMKTVTLAVFMGKNSFTQCAVGIRFDLKQGISQGRVKMSRKTMVKTWLEDTEV